MKPGDFWHEEWTDDIFNVILIISCIVLPDDKVNLGYYRLFVISGHVQRAWFNEIICMPNYEWMAESQPLPDILVVDSENLK